MAFMSILLMLFASLAFVGIVLGFLFLIGMIFLIAGLVMRRKPKYTGKKSPIVCIITGVVFLILPVGTAVFITFSMIASLFSDLSENAGYEKMTGSRQNEQYIGDTPALAHKNFQTTVYNFSGVCSNGLSFCEYG